MNIVHGVLSLDVGGLERIVVELARVSQRRGHRVSVICIERPGQLAPDIVANGARIFDLAKPPGRHAQYVQHARNLLVDLKPDVVHTHQIGAAWYLGPAAQSAQVPVLHTEHGNHLLQGRGIADAIQGRLRMALTARNIDTFCCVSKEIAAAVSRWHTVNRAKLRVVANGIATDRRPKSATNENLRAKLGIPPTAPIVGTVGRLTEVKRQSLLIRAFARAHTSFPDSQLIIVGDGPERQKLEALTSDLGLNRSVHFVGYQQRPEDYLAVIDVFALTSQSEGFPVSLLEAWNAGLAVACSAVGGINEIVRHDENGLLFAAGDEAAAAIALERLIADRTLREQLGRAGQSAVTKQYSLDHMASEYERLYAELITL
jgi:glycosyltransferase involved in cell wall biosynthesis